jgi:hypothetical protein
LTKNASNAFAIPVLEPSHAGRAPPKFLNSVTYGVYRLLDHTILSCQHNSCCPFSISFYCGYKEEVSDGIFSSTHSQAMKISTAIHRSILPVISKSYAQNGYKLPRLCRCFSSNSSEMTVLDPSTLFAKFPLQFLRAMGSSHFDSRTSQRTDVSFDVKDGKPIIRSDRQSLALTISECTSDGSYYYVTWKDGQVSQYSIDWLNQTLQKWKGTDTGQQRVLWKGMSESTIRDSSSLCISFHDAISDDGMIASLTALYRYGFVLITNTPIDDNGAGIAALASALGGGSNKNGTDSYLMHYREGRHNDQIMLQNGAEGPLRTLYGTIWSTSTSSQTKGTSIADSSFGHNALPLHTDMTYRYDPPGLQIFTMVQPALKGGESVICDGFAVASQLQQIDPDAFEMLSKTIRRYYCIDYTTGWHMEASGSVIGIDHNNSDRIVMIRHNDLDRLPYLQTRYFSETMEDYYSRLCEAHRAWDQLLANEAYRLVIKLQPGETIVVANQVRVLQLLLSRHIFFPFYLTVCITIYSDAFMDDIVLSQVPTHHEL